MEEEDLQHPIYNKIDLWIVIDLFNLEVMPELYSCVFSICSALKLTRILLNWSPDSYIHISVRCHRHIDPSLYLHILSLFVKAGHLLVS